MNAQKHPYSKFEHTNVWRVLEQAVQELVDNNDIKELTNRTYIIGYLAKRLSEDGLLKDKNL
jgi:hypothetical protein